MDGREMESGKNSFNSSKEKDAGNLALVDLTLLSLTKVKPEHGMYIGITQVSLGDVIDGKGPMNVPLRLKVRGKDFVIGSLGEKERSQLVLSLDFDKEFELSHDWKNGSVFFIGHTAPNHQVSDDESVGDKYDNKSDESYDNCDYESEDTSSEDELPVGSCNRQCGFWGVEVKPGQSLKVQPGRSRYIFISQAALGETKDGKGPENVPLHFKVDGHDFVIGTLVAEEKRQLALGFGSEKAFELSHGWKNGSVFFIGATWHNPEIKEESEYDTDSEDSTDSEFDTDSDKEDDDSEDDYSSSETDSESTEEDTDSESSEEDEF